MPQTIMFCGNVLAEIITTKCHFADLVPLSNTADILV